MSASKKELRSTSDIFLVGSIESQITGAKLPSNRQVLSVFYHNMRHVGLPAQGSANLVIREVEIFWEKARIPIRAHQHCVNKLIKMYEEHRNIQKAMNKPYPKLELRKKAFEEELDNLFDIAHANALEKIKIEEDRQFLIQQRKPGRIGSMAGIDKKLAKKEERSQLRKRKENVDLRIEPEQSTSSGLESVNVMTTSALSSSSSAASAEKSSSSSSVIPEIKRLKLAESATRTRGTTSIITEKVVGALDRCELSSRKAVIIISAVAEACGRDLSELNVNYASVQRVRDNLREAKAQKIKEIFQDNIPPFVMVHFDGKLLPRPNVRENPVERLPVLVTCGKEEQLLGVPKLENSKGKTQASAVFLTLGEWGLQDRVEMVCCDTTNSNTGRFNGACVLLEQKLNRDLLLLPCRHHIYELILKSVFESQLPQVTQSADIPFFKTFQKNWSQINANHFEDGVDDSARFISEDLREHLLETFYSHSKSALRGDYQELFELGILFLNGDSNHEIRIRPPGAMHQARWMARAIYCLKMYLFRSQLKKLTTKDRKSLLNVCVFLVTQYLNLWMNCTSAVKAAKQDLTLIQTLIDYPIQSISREALKTLSRHLWYLNEEAIALSFFDEEVSIVMKRQMVMALGNESNEDTRLTVKYNDILSELNVQYIILFHF